MVTYKRGFTMNEYFGSYHMNSDDDMVYGADLSTYFNDPKVREAFHIPSYIPPFEFASGTVFNQYTWMRQGSGFITDLLHKYGYKMLHIFGVTDAATSLLGVRRWIKSLKWEMTSGWEPWFEGEELVGNTRRYGNFSLTTINGMGHNAMFNKLKETQKLIFDHIFNK